MKIGKKAFAAMFAVGLSSSCAYAQTASTATTATFTAVVAQVNKATGTISLAQTLPTKPTAVHDSPSLTADYQASTTLLNKATVGAVVQATVQLSNGNLAVIALQTSSGVPTASSTPTPTSSSVSAASNPARLTPLGIQ